ncbi:hypothetical protein PT974_10375 [Cladobotryum mycophilum]|uniref:Uncharacterized protein n=1 Tax=Cladobotryum mycophilum TaxID=491253 RepID=A0ABR0S9N5_9HYPO
MDYAQVIANAQQVAQTLATNKTTRTAELQTIEVSPSKLLNEAFTALNHFTDLVIIDGQPLQDEKWITEHEIDLINTLSKVNDAYQTALNKLKEEEAKLGRLVEGTASDIDATKGSVTNLNHAQVQVETEIKDQQVSMSQLEIRKGVLEGQVSNTQTELEKARRTYEENEEAAKPAYKRNQSLFWKIIGTIGEGSGGMDLPPGAIGPLQQIRQAAELEMEQCQHRIALLNKDLQQNYNDLESVKGNLELTKQKQTTLVNLKNQITDSLAHTLQFQNSCADHQQKLFTARQSSLLISSTLIDLKAKSHAHLKLALRNSFADTILDIIRKTPPNPELLGRAKEIMIKFERIPEASEFRTGIAAEIVETQKWIGGQIQGLSIMAY